jgi:hypothetical protein
MLRCCWNVYTNRPIWHVRTRMQTKAHRNLDFGSIAAKDTETRRVHSMCVSLGFCTHRCARAHTHTHTHANTNKHTHTHTQTNTHTGTHTQMFLIIYYVYIRIWCTFLPSRCMSIFLVNWWYVCVNGTIFFLKHRILVSFQIVKIYYKKIQNIVCCGVAIFI